MRQFALLMSATPNEKSEICDRSVGTGAVSTIGTSAVSLNGKASASGSRTAGGASGSRAAGGASGSRTAGGASGSRARGAAAGGGGSGSKVRGAAAGGPPGEKTVAQNKKATHDYFIEETFHAGIALTGTEIKSIRSGKANLKDSYARVERGEVYLHNLHISPYEAGNRFNHDPLRARKLLLHRSEIRKLIGATKEQGYSLVPLRLYLRGGFCKVELALARGKKNYDKRDAIAKRDADREIARAFRERQKG